MRQQGKHKTESILEVHDLKVNFEGFWALTGVNLSIAKGELRVLIGANGAGKSTLFDIMCGKTKASSGRVVFGGEDITHWSEARIARAGIGRKFQAPTVFRSLTVAENLDVAKNRTFALAKNVFLPVTRRPRAEFADVLARFHLEEAVDTPAGQLAHGQMQWLELAMLVMRDPDVLLLDEPTAGMTVSETEQTSRIIEDLNRDHTVVVVEHDMEFVRQICETITVLHQGKVLAEGNAGEIETNPHVKEAYLGSHGVSRAEA
jgi:urea transport system ATP-binding protein